MGGWVWEGRRLTAPDGEPVAWLGALVGWEAVEGFFLDVLREGVGWELADEGVQVGAVED